MSPGWARAAASASSPVPASSTVRPAPLSARATSARSGASSSASSTVAAASGVAARTASTRATGASASAARGKVMRKVVPTSGVESTAMVAPAWLTMP